MAPPTPPMPVPSKAAIRALRGLVLGTTCTLALVTEDRRRRINAARSAVRNGDRIRSARQYHPGGSAFAIALEEESLSVEPGVIHWKSPARQGHVDGRASNLHREPMTTRTSQGPTTNWSEAILAPSRKERASSPSRRQSASSIKTVAATAAAESLPQSRTQPPTTSPSLSPSESQPRPFAYPPPASERIQRSVPSLAHQAQEYRARARLGGRVHRSVIPLGRVNSVPVPVVDLSAVMTGQVKALSKPLKTPADLEVAVRTLLNTWPIINATSDQHPALGKASAELCQSCQQAGRMDLAQAVLQLAVKFGQLDEATYFAHNPFPVVQSLAPLDALKAELADAEMDETGADARRDAFVKRLEDAASLFLPAFASAPATVVSTSQLVVVGKQLLECAFAIRHHESINAINSSIAKYSGDITELSQWYNTQLQKTGDHALLVSSFVARPPSASSLSKTTFFEIGDRVVEATRLSHYTQAGSVLETLITLSAPVSYRLRTAWVTDLLYGQWQKGKDYSEIKSLFAKLVGPSQNQKELASTVYHADGAYRVMVQIALEADKPVEAKAVYDELTAIQPSAASDIRLLGLFALAKAKAGDWQGVQDDFQKAAAAAAPKGGLAPRDAERVFVPIAKEYVRTHTIGETEDFLKLYIDEVGVPIGRHMVTLLANEYGALREVRSFVAWLDYCVEAGFTVDAAFSNAILHNCRKHWKFGFRELRTMYRKLRLLSPNFEDKVTQTIMTHAAIADAKSIGRTGAVVKGRVVSLRIHNSNTPHSAATMTTLAAAAQQQGSSYTSPLSASRHLLDEHDLHVAMKQAFASGAPTKVVRMYKHAVRGGMPPSDKCLKLAVAAAVKSEQLLASTSSPVPTKRAPDFDVAIDLLKTAHGAGQDIDGATTYLAIAYIDALGNRRAATVAKARQPSAKASVAAAVKSVLLRLDACDVQMTDLALNRAAFHMFKAGHMSGAIALATSAANSPVGGGRLGYNVWNFSVLISAYARLADAAGIRMATEGAAASGILRELMGYKVLKQARRRLRASQLEHECAPAAHGPNHHHGHGHASPNARKAHGDGLQAALQAVEDALDQARAARQQLSAERRALEVATISIMQQAALDAGHAPVDFDEQHKLRRRQQQQQQRRKQEDGSSSTGSVSSGSSWDLLDMPVDQEGRLIHAEEQAAPRAASASF